LEVRDMLAVLSGHGSWPWFFVFPVLWLSVIVAFAFLFRRRRWGHWHGGSGEAVLGERYARGEITEEEYRQRITVLREASR
jgi:putative membrane protein